MWFKRIRAENLPISGPMIQSKAIEFARDMNQSDFLASTGWLQKFKSRHKIVQHALCGESASVNEEQCQKWRLEILPSIIRRYRCEDIYNADETGLFFRCLPNKTLAFKGEKCFGGKCSKERVTCLVGSNMTGSEKLKILMIGKSANPRCFRGIQNLGVDYKSNKNAWMTSNIFEEWLLKLDKKFLKQNRKILLFIDNCPAHPKDIQNKLKSITLEYFPANTTSKLQPMDMGVIHVLKMNYRRRILAKVIKNLMEKQGKYSITLLDCVREISSAWSVDVTSEHLANCFRRAGFSEWTDEDNLPLSELRLRLKSENPSNEVEILGLYQMWNEINPNDSNINYDDFINVDDGVATYQHPTDSEIVNLVNGGNDSSDEEEQDTSECTTVKKPSIEEIQQAVNILRRALETCKEDECIDNMHLKLWDFEKFLLKRQCSFVQTNTIYSYFKGIKKN